MPDTVEVFARHKLTVDDYHRMAEAGIFEPTDRVELIDGQLIDMAPIGEDHAYIVDELTERLVLASAGRARVSVQNPIRVDRLNEPQPDFAVARVDEENRKRRAGPENLLLVVEVADSSLRLDRTVKLPIYARAGIVEVWIVDVQRLVLESHRVPVNGAYTEVATYQAGQTVAIAAMPEIAVALNGVFD